MEDKSSFYEFLAANSKLTNEEKKVHPLFLLIAWIIVFLINASVLYIGWNYAVSSLTHLEKITFLQSTLLYSACKVLFRGFFSVQ